MVGMKDPLLEYVEGTGRKYFQLDQKYGTSIMEEIKLVGPPPQGTSKVGKLVLNAILAEKKNQRGSLGSCWRVTLRRMEQAWKKAYGKSFIPLKGSEEWKMFDTIAGTRYEFRAKEWNKAPRSLRRRGVAGAMAYVKAAKIIEGNAVWKDIDPGSPLQLWSAWPIGHAPILYRYVHNLKGKTVAMVLADQWVSFIIMKRGGTRTIFGAKFTSAMLGSGKNMSVKTSALGNANVVQERIVCPRALARIPGPVDKTKISVDQSGPHRGPVGVWVA